MLFRSARQPRGSCPDALVDIVDDSGAVRNLETLYMNGPAVFQFSIGRIPRAIAQTVEHAQLTISDFQLVLLHQANKMMLDLIYKKLKVPASAQFMFSEKIGNLGGTSSAVLLVEALRQQKIKPGDRTLLAGFGNGLAWGVAGVKWGALPALSSLPVEYAALLGALSK